MSKPSWDDYFLAIAWAVADRSTCPRLSVGAVLVRDRDIIATGYNGSPSGLPECLDAGCLLRHGRCLRAVHAEVNAVIRAARSGVSTLGTTCYSTHAPCLDCAKVLVNAGVKRVVYTADYGNGEGLRLLREAGLEVKAHGQEAGCEARRAQGPAAAT